MKASNSYYITLDCDWATSEMIIESAQVLIDKNIKATWFITDENEGVDFLKKYPHLFELGIHPNLMENSTQGRDEMDIINFLKEIVKNSKLVRTHGLFQSSNILHRFTSKYGLKIDSSLFLPFCKQIEPHFLHFSDSTLFRIPYNWGDNYALNNFDSLKSNFDLIKINGLKVFNFHPIHIYYNIASIEHYNKIKQKLKLGEQVQEKSEFGIRDYLKELISRTEKQGMKSQKLLKIYDEFEY